MYITIVVAQVQGWKNKNTQIWGLAWGRGGNPRGQVLRSKSSKGTVGDGLVGCAGATPHSGNPFGLSIRFGSHSS